MPGSEVTATVETVGVVVCAWAMVTDARNRARIASSGSSLVNAHVLHVNSRSSRFMGSAARNAFACTGQGLSRAPWSASGA